MAFSSMGKILRVLWGLPKPAVKPECVVRPLSLTSSRLEQNEADENEETTLSMEKKSKKPKRPLIDAVTSIRYMESEAFKEAYGDDPVWRHYRRNFRGGLPPKTRKTCVRQKEISTGTPCPICRDEYLVLHMKNVKLLEQFISPHTGEVLHSMKTGLCQKQQKRLILEVLKARNHGFIEGSVPFRVYDYSEYLPPNKSEIK